MNAVLRDSHAWTGTPGPTTQAQDMWLGRYANHFLNGQMDTGFHRLRLVPRWGRYAQLYEGAFHPGE